MGEFRAQDWGARNFRCAGLLLMSLAIAAMGAFGQQKSKAASNKEKHSAQRMVYVRPNFHERVRRYAVSTFGPVPIARVVLGAAIGQADDSPPDWEQGWAPYGERVASHLGSDIVQDTTNFALSEVLREDNKYYPCACRGIWPRLKHVVLSSVTARAGENGHRIFSIPAVISPYAGAFASLGWYPPRFGPKDAFRTGNYTFLTNLGMTIALEFTNPLLKKMRWSKFFYKLLHNPP